MSVRAELALQIARDYPGQITDVDQHGVTSLDLMLTIPGLFRSQTLLGFSESILYLSKCSQTLNFIFPKKVINKVLRSAPNHLDGTNSHPKYPSILMFM